MVTNPDVIARSSAAEGMVEGGGAHRTLPGLLPETSSELELGIQAADVAAAIAAKAFEEASDDRPAGRASAVKILFAGVCLNGV
jgi:hypothetical protein